MRPRSLLLGVFAVSLLGEHVCNGQQQCDTSAFTYNPSTGVYYMPGGLSSATSASQCSCLQQQWNTINQEIQAQHQNCLNANQGQPENPNSGSYPGSSCSYSACQSLHDALFTTMAPKEQQEIAACNAAVAQYQSELQAQQAAQQAEQQQQELAAQVAQQRRAAELQLIKQQIAASIKTQQDAAQLMATLLQQFQGRTSQSGDSPTPENEGMNAATSDAPGVTVVDYTDPNSLPKDSPGVSVLNFPGPPSNSTQGSNSSSDPGQGANQEPPGDLASNTGVVNPATGNGINTGNSATPGTANSLPSNGSRADVTSDSSQSATQNLVSDARDQINSVVTPELQGALGDAALDAGKDAVKDWVEQSGVYGELLVGATEQATTFATTVSNFTQQASNLVDVFTGKTSSEQTADIMFTNLQQLGAQMLNGTVAGTLFKNGSAGIWNANSVALGNLDQELSMAQSDSAYNEQQLDQLSDPTKVAQTAIFGICSYCERLYNAQQIVSGEWALLSAKFGWNVSDGN